MGHQITAVYFDFGNVLTLPPADDEIDLLVQLGNGQKERFLRAYRTHRDDYDRGTIGSETFWQRVFDDEVSLTQRTVEKLTEYDNRAWGRINEDVLQVTKVLSEKALFLGILSNMPTPYAHFGREHFPWLSRFDALILSCEVGAVKPEEMIYRRAIEVCGASPEEILFIDDLEENIVAARTVGMQGIVFSGAKELLEDLKEEYSLL